MKIFIYSTFDKKAQEALQAKLPSESGVIFKEQLSDQESQQVFRECEVLMGNPPREWFVQIPSSLKFWQIDSAGFNQYEGLKVKIPVANMGDLFAKECAETMMAGILAFYRGVHQLVKFQERKEWKGMQIRNSLENLSDQRVLILGTGTIGLALKKMLSGFGSHVMMTARKNPIADLHDFNDILKELSHVDLVINTLPGTAEQYVSTEFFDSMKNGSLYANVGRGNTTDEKALIHNLQTGKLRGAILDVTEEEPLPTNNPLWEMENVILTQHTGGGSVHEVTGKIDRFVKNLNAFTNKKPIEDQVDLAMGY